MSQKDLETKMEKYLRYAFSIDSPDDMGFFIESCNKISRLLEGTTGVVICPGDSVSKIALFIEKKLPNILFIKIPFSNSLNCDVSETAESLLKNGVFPKTIKKSAITLLHYPTRGMNTRTVILRALLDFGCVYKIKIIEIDNFFNANISKRLKNAESDNTRFIKHKDYTTWNIPYRSVTTTKVSKKRCFEQMRLIELYNMYPELYKNVYNDVKKTTSDVSRGDVYKMSFYDIKHGGIILKTMFITDIYNDTNKKIRAKCVKTKKMYTIPLSSIFVSELIKKIPFLDKNYETVNITYCDKKEGGFKEIKCQLSMDNYKGNYIIENYRDWKHIYSPDDDNNKIKMETVTKIEKEPIKYTQCNFNFENTGVILIVDLSSNKKIKIIFISNESGYLEGVCNGRVYQIPYKDIINFKIEDTYKLFNIPSYNFKEKYKNLKQILWFKVSYYHDEGIIKTIEKCIVSVLSNIIFEDKIILLEPNKFRSVVFYQQIIDIKLIDSSPCGEECSRNHDTCKNLPGCDCKTPGHVMRCLNKIHDNCFTRLLEYGETTS